MSLRKLASSRNVVCTGTSSIRIAWTLPLKYLSVKPVLLMKKGWFLEVESRLGNQFKVFLQKFTRRRTHSHKLWLLLVTLVILLHGRCGIKVVILFVGVKLMAAMNPRLRRRQHVRPLGHCSCMLQNVGLLTWPPTPYHPFYGNPSTVVLFFRFSIFWTLTKLFYFYANLRQVKKHLSKMNSLTKIFNTGLFIT